MDKQEALAHLWQVKFQRRVILASGFWQITALLFTDYFVYKSFAPYPHIFVLYSSIVASIFFSIIALINEKWYQLVPFLFSQLIVYSEFLRNVIYPLATMMIEEMRTKKLDFHRFVKYDLTFWLCVFIMMVFLYAFFCTISIMMHFYKKDSQNIENPDEESSLFTTISLVWNGPAENRENSVRFTVNPNFENSTIRKPYA